MNTEFDYDLTPDQWETLKALRSPAAHAARDYPSSTGGSGRTRPCGHVEDLPLLTTRGRKVLIRGSSRLLDVAA